MTIRPPRLGSPAVDLSIIVALIAILYLPRLSELTVRGEESRRAAVAIEMMHTGDWIVPRQQGEPFLSRPPFQNWLIALTTGVRGKCDLIAARLPSIAAIIGIALVIYFYSRSFAAGAGAFAAAVSFIAMPEILQMGRQAESDMVFAFLLGSALLLWHCGWMRDWPRALTWSLGYVFLALATLTKGPQAPVTFGLAIGLYLLATRQVAELFSRGHFVGLAVYSLLFGGWLAPCIAQIGWHDTWLLLTADSTGRFVGWKLADVLQHLLQYPIETIGCTATASLLLVVFLSRRFWQTLGPVRPHAIFLLLCIGAGFVPCWISPGGKTRYLMGIYPALAALSGLVFDRVAEADLAGWLRATLSWGQRLLAISALGAAAVVAWLAWGADGIVYDYWKQPGWLAIAFFSVAIAVAWLNWRGPFASRSVRCAQGVLLACLLGLVYGGVIINQLMARQSGAEAGIAELKQIMPAESHLVSLDPIHHKFIFLYGRPIQFVPWNESERVPPGSYFCFNRYANDCRQIPFPAEELAVLNMDRIDCPNPETTYVVVARRLGNSGKELLTARK